MAYSFISAASSVFAGITLEFGSDYYDIDQTLGSFATACNASYSNTASIPPGLSSSGSMVCNTNTGDLVTESGISVSFFTDVVNSILSRCITAQAQAFQGADNCNPPTSTNTWYIIGGIVGALFLLGICSKAKSLGSSYSSPRSRSTLFTPRRTAPAPAATEEGDSNTILLLNTHEREETPHEDRAHGVAHIPTPPAAAFEEPQTPSSTKSGF